AVEVVEIDLAGERSRTVRQVEEGVGVVRVIVLLRVEAAVHADDALLAEIRPGVEVSRFRIEKVVLRASRIAESVRRGGVPFALEGGHAVFEVLVCEVPARLEARVASGHRLRRGALRESVGT